jgi:hypothetical protein
MRKLKLASLGFISVLAGCGGGSHLILDPDLLTYTATSQVTANNPMRFSTTVVVSNTTTEPITFTTTCPIPRTVIYANAAHTGAPIWDSNTRSPQPACAATTTTVGVGRSVSYTLNATGAEALGASGNPGTYYLVDSVTLDGITYAVPAGSIAIAR